MTHLRGFSFVLICLLLSSQGGIFCRRATGKCLNCVRSGCRQCHRGPFRSRRSRETDVLRLLDFSAVRATIAQTARFTDGATEAVYVESLRAVLNGERPTHDPFRFLVVQERLADIRKTLQILSERQRVVAESVSNRIGNYTPPDTRSIQRFLRFWAERRTGGRR